MRVLSIEDDPALADMLRRRLWREGHVVDVAPDGASGLERAQSGAYDAVILDLMLPDIDGVAVAQRLRAAGLATPILMLTARDALHDRLHGLDAGADDYLTKPFAFEELAARLRAITRRGKEPVQDDRLVVGDLVLERRTRVVTRGGRVLALAPKEFALLEYLMRHPGQVITRTILLERVWDYGFDPFANVVDAAIRRLRRAVDAGEVRPLIHTVRGVGYKIEERA
jgi:two-component system OmpR family response regulator